MNTALMMMAYIAPFPLGATPAPQFEASSASNPSDGSAFPSRTHRDPLISGPHLSGGIDQWLSPSHQVRASLSCTDDPYHLSSPLILSQTLSFPSVMMDQCPADCLLLSADDHAPCTKEAPTIRLSQGPHVISPLCHPHLPHPDSHQHEAPLLLPGFEWALLICLALAVARKGWRLIQRRLSSSHRLAPNHQVTICDSSTSHCAYR